MKIKEFINKYFDTIETILLLGFAAGMIMILMQIEHSYLILRISLGAIAVLYWFKAIEKNDEQKISKKISEKAIWFALLLTPIAILSKLQFSENANIFLLVSIILLVLSISYRIFEQKKSKNKINIGEFTRVIVAIILCIFVFSLPI